jgi:AraC-like DNA-binding protein
VISTEASVPKKILALKDSDFETSSEHPKLTLVSGAYQLWNDPVHPFFDELPEWYILKSGDIERYEPLQVALDLLSEEVAHPKIGSETIVQAFLDILFSYLIRRIVEKNGIQEQTWSRAIQEPPVRRAIELLHGDCAADWTLSQLAQQVGLSRAGFALKFKRAMGDTPLHYLATVRVQTAMNLLITTDQNLDRIAEAVGYGDAFSFSKVFKKLTGVPPREFRARDQRERDTGWRLS